MNLKSKLLHLSLVGYLSILHLTANAAQITPKPESNEIHDIYLTDTAIDQSIEKLQSYLPSPVEVYYAKLQVLGELSGCALKSAMYEIPCYPKFLKLIEKLKKANLKLTYEYEPVMYTSNEYAHMMDIKNIIGLIGESIAISNKIHLTHRYTQIKNPQTDDLIKLADGFAQNKEVINFSEDYILNSIFASDFMNYTTRAFLGLIPFIKNGSISPNKLFSCQGPKANTHASLIDFLNLAYDTRNELKLDNESDVVLQVYKNEIPDALTIKKSSNWIPNGYDRFQKDKDALEVVKYCYFFRSIKKYDE